MFPDFEKAFWNLGAGRTDVSLAEYLKNDEVEQADEWPIEALFLAPGDSTEFHYIPPSAALESLDAIARHCVIKETRKYEEEYDAFMRKKTGEPEPIDPWKEPTENMRQFARMAIEK